MEEPEVGGTITTAERADASPRTEEGTKEWKKRNT